MNALSVVKPWGTKIANKEKTLEIRSWRPNSLPLKNIALVENKIKLVTEGQEDPNGYIVALVDIVGCKPWVKSDSTAAGLGESDFIDGYWAWQLENVKKLTKSINTVAKRKFYKLNSEIINQIKLGIKK